ncbi:MAG: formate dehydrogenase accessory sulfurtransferase FdhD [Bacteroidota bacterium]|nr:formate dehydrogenase accessory sulfurtransferase FdhD [Kiloniellaceae bacterium]
MDLRCLVRAPLPHSPLVQGTVVSDRGAESAVWGVPEEIPLAVLLNGESFAVMMGTPADLEDFAVGFALTEGIVEDIADIASLRIAEAQDGLVLNLRVDPAQAAAVADRRRSLAGRTGCGVCGAQTIAAALPRPPRVGGPQPDIVALQAAYAALPALQPMNAENRSTHAAAFCDPDGRIALLREDIGRHNALDKLGGALARDGRNAAAGFILLSSRISVELVQKAAVLRAPFLAAVSAPSALALRVAEQAGMGLAGLARGGIMIFETGTDRKINTRGTAA